MNDFKEIPDDPVFRKGPEVLQNAIYRIVRQNQSVDEFIKARDERTFTIITQGRIGCDAGLLWTIEPNGNEHVTMTHYDPKHVQDHLRLIDERKRTHPQGHRYGILLTRAGAQEGYGQLAAEALTQFVGGDIDIVRMQDLGLDEALEQIDPLSFEKHAKYQLSFTRGYGGDMKVHKIKVEGSDYDKTITLE